MKKILAVLLAICSVFVVFSACSGGEGNNESETIDYKEMLTNKENPVATIEMEDGGVMLIELFYDTAPNTVKNFISLANKGFYDGLTFHRVIPGFMIQGGDPKGNGTGGPGYNIFGEFSNNGFENNRKHLRGYVSMARKGNPYNPPSMYNTAGSQFFICVEDQPSLDNDYAVFGYCFYGMNVADAIVSVKTDANDKPLKDVKIKTITVDFGDKTYEEPETLM